MTDGLSAVAPARVRPLQSSDFETVDVTQAAAARLLHDPRLTEWLAAACGVGLTRQPFQAGVFEHIGILTRSATLVAKWVAAHERLAR